MALEFECPFCQKAYPWKETYAGKKVTCANRDCRKVFTAENPRPAKAAAKVTVPPEDAEALAAAAFAEEEAPPEDQRVVAMTCAVCEHKWTEPWAKQGKNTLCPECKTRQKVPEQKDPKKARWQDARKAPSLAKVEELEGVQASTDLGYVSGQTLKQVGAVRERYEARPTSFYVKAFLGVSGVALLAGAAVFYFTQSRTDRQQHQLAARAVDEIDAKDLAGPPPGTAPLFRAAVLTAAAEYHARQTNPPDLKGAADLLGRARQAADDAPAGGERSVLLAGLAAVVPLLGGETEAVREGHKLPWVPAPTSRTTTPQLKATGNVQQELTRVFEALRREGKTAEPEVRAAVFRQTARDLIGRGQEGMLDALIPALFFPQEMAEAHGQLGLELVRAGKADKARPLADMLRLMLAGGGAGGSGTPAYSAQALWQALDPPVQGPALAPPPGGDRTSLASRLAYTELQLVKGQTDEAVKTAALPGPAGDRLLALMLVAEWADRPDAALDPAHELVQAEVKRATGPAPLPAFALVRLAAAAARAGKAEQAQAFAAAVQDDGLRAWAKAEAVRERVNALGGQPADEAWAEVPDDPKKLRVGHARGRYLVARHNAAVTGDPELVKAYEGWAAAVRPFGLVGAALGLQDRDRKK